MASSTQPSSSSLLPLRATITREELSTIPRAEQYQLLGVESGDQLALGIDVDDVLEYIGTKSDLMNKFMTDLPHLVSTTTTTTDDNGSSNNNVNDKVEQEVNKFLLDGEMLDIMIKYEQRKRDDPSWEPQYSSTGDESSIINKTINFVSQYGVYVVGAILVKDVVVGIMNKYNAGGGWEDVGMMNENTGGGWEVCDEYQMNQEGEKRFYDSNDI